MMLFPSTSSIRPRRKAQAGRPGAAAFSVVGNASPIPVRCTPAPGSQPRSRVGGRNPRAVILMTVSQLLHFD